MKAKVLDINGNPVKEIELPVHFEEEIREDLVKRAYWAVFSHSLQPYGPDPLAGKRRVVWWHKRRRKRFRTFYGWGVSRSPRYIIARYGGGWGQVWVKAGFAPFTVGGRRAHPPKVEKRLYEYINKKERRKAIRSCIAASANRYFILKRGHRIPENISLPIVVTDDLETLSKTKDVYSFLKKIGLEEELRRVEEKKIRAGVGKMRGRKYKKKVGPLIVISGNKPILKAAKNIPGVDVRPVYNLSLLDLAPGAKPGRLIIWSESAIKMLKNYYR